ncbi:MAG TPA: DUF1559 domain-containing protein, partial [Planctomycetia bacterium]|nr:DUF1559 domain-containing protein [Planctomycetia bacterium]
TMFLPYLEQAVTFDTYNFSLASCNAANATSIARKVDQFICPSNPRGAAPLQWGYYIAPRGFEAPGPAPADYALSHGSNGYVAGGHPFGTGGRKSKWPATLKKSAGAFGVNSSTLFEDFKDGTSKSLAIGESAGGSRFAPASARGALVKGDEPADGTDATKVCDQAWAQGFIGDEKGAGGLGSMFAATAWDYSVGGKWFPIPINELGTSGARPTYLTRGAAGPDAGGSLPGEYGSIQGYRSFHAGGANIAMADGAVMFLSQSIDAAVLANLGTIAGGD